MYTYIYIYIYMWHVSLLSDDMSFRHQPALVAATRSSGFARSYPLKACAEEPVLLACQPAVWRRVFQRETRHHALLAGATPSSGFARSSPSKSSADESVLLACQIAVLRHVFQGSAKHSALVAANQTTSFARSSPSKSCAEERVLLACQLAVCICLCWGVQVDSVRYVWKSTWSTTCLHPEQNSF